MDDLRKPLLTVLFLVVTTGSLWAAPPVPERIKGVTVPASRADLFVDLSAYNRLPGKPAEGAAVPLESLLDFDAVKTKLFNGKTNYTQIPFRSNGKGYRALFHDGSANADQATAVRKYLIHAEDSGREYDYVVTMIVEKEYEEEEPDFDFLDKPNITGVIFYSDLMGNVFDIKDDYNGRILQGKILKPDEKPAQGENVVHVEVFSADASGMTEVQTGSFCLTDAKDFDHRAQREMIKIFKAEGNLGYWKKLQEGKPLVGEKFLDLRESDPKGKYHRISDYAGKGQWVLVDFWASWCGPCKREMPNVTAAYKKYHDKGFEIIGLSFDADLADWKEAIASWDMPWIHLSDLQYWQSKAAKLYGIHAIPDNILIDPDGIIVARGLRGRELEAWLEEIFK